MKKTAFLALLLVSAAPQDEKQEYVSMTVEELLAAAGPRLGVKFVYSEDIGLKNKRVTVPAFGDKTTKSEVQSVLESALFVTDFTMVPPDEKGAPTLVMSAATAVKRPLPTLGPAEPLPAGNSMCTKVFKLKSVGPREVHAALINIVTYPQGVQPLEGAGSIVVTDYAANIRRIGKIIESIDKGD